MEDEPGTTDNRLFEELQELVSLEMKDIMATAAEEGFSRQDVVAALELALQVEIQALAASAEAKSDFGAEKGQGSAAI
jgi:hypothetical protein